MSNLPRLELTEENSNLKNNDFIIFRNQNKNNIQKSIKNKTPRKKSRKTSRKTSRKKHYKKRLFGIF